MRSFYPVVGLILSALFFAVAIIWAPTNISQSPDFLNYFATLVGTTLSIFLPFFWRIYLPASSDSYVYVVAYFFGHLCSVISVILFVMLYWGFSYKFFWTIQIVVWSICISLVFFAKLSLRSGGR